MEQLKWCKLLVMQVIFEVWMLPATIINNIPVPTRYVGKGTCIWWMEKCFAVWSFQFKSLYWVSKRFQIFHWLVALDREREMYDKFIENRLDQYKEIYSLGGAD